jgi:SAM-dependent methyltransferase
MIDRLFHLLKRPALWQRSAEAFWDDAHISKGMLDAHLNPDWDAASRRHEFIDSSVKWLSEIIPAGGKVLDLGCGPGLYTKRLSGLGYDVTGIDFSKRSVDYARSRDAETEYIYKNYLELDYTAVFDAVTLIYCDYASLTLSERKTLAAKVYNALKPGGLFILDVFTEPHFADKQERSSWKLNENGGFWSEAPHIYLEAVYLYEKGTVSAEQCVVINRDSVKEYLIWDTVYTATRLADELKPYGFNVKGMYDDVSGAEYTCEAETLCMIFEKKL